MKEYVYKLFLKNELLEEELLSSSLYASCDAISALRADYKLVISTLKVYDSIEIIKSNERNLQEGYQQGLYIIEVLGKKYFLRLILSDGLIYDILVYSLTDIDLINKIFFNQEEINIPKDYLDALMKKNPTVILLDMDTKYRILKANKEFYDLIKYEDWDFANKYQNILNQIAYNQEINNIENIKLYQSDKTLLDLNFTYKKNEKTILLEMREI